MKVALTSDLHGHLPKIPDCDILVIAGDICPIVSHSFNFQERWLLSDFKDWIGGIDAEVVIIAGNHDFVMQERPHVPKSLPVHYLCDSGKEVLGLKFYGMPWTPEFGGWAFNAGDIAMELMCDGIPSGLDFLITHGPPSNNLGMTVSGVDAGSRHLEIAINRAKPKYHVFGHIHECGGMKESYWNDKHQHISYNVAYLDHKYQPNGCPILVLDI